MKNCWTLLGISPGSGIEEIRRAFAEASRKHHPEEDQERFRQLQDAYREALRLAAGRGAPRRQESPFRTPGDMGSLAAGGQDGADGALGSGDPSCGGGARDAGAPAVRVRFPGDDAPASCPDDPARPSPLRFPSGRPEGPRDDPQPDAPPARGDAGPALRFPASREGAGAPDGQDEASDPEDPARLRFPQPGAPEGGPPREGPRPASTGGRPPAGGEGALLFPLPVFPLPGLAGAIPLVFPSGSGGEGDPGSPPPAGPMTRQAGDVRDALLLRMAAMAEAGCSADDWLRLTGGDDFALFMPDAAFLAGVAALCRDHLDNGLCAALYMAYGLSSRRAPLRSLPAAGTLVRLLEAYAGLPAADFPHEGQAAALDRTGLVLQRMARLAAWPPCRFVWQQYCQTEEFRRAGCQPYFIGRAYQAARADAGLLQELDRLYGRTPFRPAGLPPAGPVQASGPQEPLRDLSRFLIEEDREAFYAAARADLLSLLERTARHFRFSGSRSPWDYVFGRPQFEMLRLDACFVHALAGFILAHELPPAFFSSLDAAYGTGALPAGACPSALPGSDAAGALDMLRHAARERRHGGAQPTLWDRLAQRLRGKGN